MNAAATPRALGRPARAREPFERAWPAATQPALTASLLRRALSLGRESFPSRVATAQSGSYPHAVATARSAAKATGTLAGRVTLVATAFLASVAALALLIAASHTEAAGFTSLTGLAAAVTSFVFAVLDLTRGRQWRGALIALAIAVVCSPIGYLMAAEGFVI